MVRKYQADQFMCYGYLRRKIERKKSRELIQKNNDLILSKFGERNRQPDLRNLKKNEKR